jgi:Phage integrase family
MDQAGTRPHQVRTEGQDECPVYGAEVCAQSPDDRAAGRRDHGVADAPGRSAQGAPHGWRTLAGSRARVHQLDRDAVRAAKLTRQFKALLTAANLPNIRLHDLRHSCATLLLAQGVNPRVVMETLGHSQESLTLNTYSHVLPALRATPPRG